MVIWTAVCGGHLEGNWTRRVEAVGIVFAVFARLPAVLQIGLVLGAPWSVAAYDESVGTVLRGDALPQHDN